MTIPTTSVDVESVLLDALRNAQPVQIGNTKPALPNPYRFLLLRADLQQKVTPISRYVRVGISGWSVLVDGRADIGDAFDITAAAGNALERLAGTGIILSADVESGPARVADDVGRIEFQYLTALLEVSVT